MSEIKQEILDLLILNGRKPQTIKSGERVVYLYDALNIVNKEFSKIEQPQLSENQQIVLEWLKKEWLGRERHYWVGLECIATLVYHGQNGDPDYYPGHAAPHVEAYEELTSIEHLEVIQAFSQWALEQEAE